MIALNPRDRALYEFLRDKEAQGPKGLSQREAARRRVLAKKMGMSEGELVDQMFRDWCTCNVESHIP